ncbi:terpene synthase family protein [Streptomyces clavuligerus]|uniref:Terpene synthase, metal-binding protein n=1 Tax=Streptomyces clavuligerus TaxID=1901 RepID=D5SLW8_STRCL|nr:terpene synthase family protein [Streptomyces clavuligerus]EFG04911.1 Terpene synthase, metal-binding protein [Streptomyces clavuligerus]WDN57456.1 terpene synthase family protein [Streptomyces clavuligerus]
MGDAHGAPGARTGGTPPEVSPALVERQLLTWAEALALVDGPEERANLSGMGLHHYALAVVSRRELEPVALVAQFAALVCLLDDAFDRPGVQADEVAALAGGLRAVLDGTAEQGRGPFEHALNDLVTRVGGEADGSWLTRFTAGFADLLDACVEEVRVRANGEVLALGARMALRRRTSAVVPALHILEAAEGIRLPGAVETLDAAGDMHRALADAIGFANDLFSVGRDRALGHPNLVEALAAEGDGCLRTARERLREMCARRLDNFDAAAGKLVREGALPPADRAEAERYVTAARRFAATARSLPELGRYRDTDPAREAGTTPNGERDAAL